MEQGYLKFKVFLLKNNIKQNEVADILNIDKSAFSKKINKNGGDFSLSEVKTICSHYNISGDEFFLL